MIDLRHLDYLEIVAAGDVKHLREKEKKYKGSWKQRGGVGAFMMLARKWDRLENILRQPQTHTHGGVTRTASPYDVFGEIQANPTGEDGTALAEIGDLRRYLMLVEAEMMARGVVGMAIKLETDEHVLGPATPEDGGQHESVWPWKTSELKFGDFQERSIISGEYRLMDHVSLPIPAENYKSVKHLYDLSGLGLILKIEQCPASVRPFYNSYPSELNHAELMNLALPLWFKNELYKWQESSGKYVLQRTAFHDENR